MEIEVVLFNSLRRVKGRRDYQLRVPDSATVEHVIAQLELPESEVALVYRNGRLASFQSRLQPGDRVALFGPVPFSRVYGAPMV